MNKFAIAACTLFALAGAAQAQAANDKAQLPPYDGAIEMQTHQIRNTCPNVRDQNTYLACVTNYDVSAATVLMFETQAYLMNNVSNPWHGGK